MQLECPICICSFDETDVRPLVGICGHSMCESCLRPGISCSICRKEDAFRFKTVNYQLIEVISKQAESSRLQELMKKQLEDVLAGISSIATVDKRQQSALLCDKCLKKVSEKDVHLCLDCSPLYCRQKPDKDDELYCAPCLRKSEHSKHNTVLYSEVKEDIREMRILHKRTLRENEKSFSAPAESRVNAPRPLPAFHDIDKLFGTDDIIIGYNTLKKRYENGEMHNEELLWRLAKCCKELSTRTPDQEKVKELIFEGEKYGVAAMEMEENNVTGFLWAIDLTGEAASHVGIREAIVYMKTLKGYLNNGLAKHPKNFELLKIRGVFAFTWAQLSWWERTTINVLFFTTLPSTTVDEALADFLAAFQVKEEDMENLLNIARCYMLKKDKVNAKVYLNMATKLKVVDKEEKQYLAEVIQLLREC